jgi:hypothetical protein
LFGGGFCVYPKPYIQKPAVKLYEGAEGKHVPIKHPKPQDAAKPKPEKVTDDPDCLQAMDEANTAWVEKWKKTTKKVGKNPK